MKKLMFLALFLYAHVSGEGLDPEVAELVKKLREGDRDDFAYVYTALRQNISKAAARPALSEIVKIARSSTGQRARYAFLCIRLLAAPDDIAIVPSILQSAGNNPESARYAADILVGLNLKKEQYGLLLKEMKREKRDKMIFIYANLIGNKTSESRDAVDLAIQLLKQKTPILVSAGARALGRNPVKDTQGVDRLLVSALNRHQELVAMDVAYALVSIEVSPAFAVSVFSKMQKKQQKKMQQAAAYGFGAFSSKSSSALREAKRIMAGKDSNQIIQLLYGMNNPNVPPTAELISDVIGILDSHGSSVDLQSARYLSRLGREAQEALPSLSRTMLEVGIKYQDDFLVALTKIQPTKECLPAIKEVLEANAGESKAELEVQRTALDALAAMGPAAAEMLPSIRDYLQSPSRAVLLSAVRAVGTMGAAAQEELPVLIELKKKAAKSDKEAIQEAIDAIRKAAGQNVEFAEVTKRPSESLVNTTDVSPQNDPLTEFGLSSDGPLNDLVANLSHKNATARRRILQAIGKRGEHAASAAKSIQALLQDRNIGVRKTAVWALGSIRSAESMPALKEALGDGAIETRTAAAWALGSIGDPSGVGPLTKSLGSDDPRLQWISAWALGSIGPAAKSSVSALTRVQAGADPVLRSAISEAIDRIQTE